MTSMLLTDRYERGAAVAGAVGAIRVFTRLRTNVEGATDGLVLSPAIAGERPSGPKNAPQPSPASGRGRFSIYTAESFVQSRGVMFFSFAYFAADSSTIPRTNSRSGVIQ